MLIISEEERVLSEEEEVVKMAEVVRPYKVVLLGKTEEGYLWQYTFLVFARNENEAMKIATKTAQEPPRRLRDVRIFEVKEYKKPRVFTEMKGGWPEDWVMEELEEIGGFDSLPEIGEIFEET